MEDKETREQAKRKNEVQVQKAKKGSQEGRKETNENERTNERTDERLNE